MKKKLVIGIICLVALGGAGFVFFPNKAQAKTPTDAAAQEQEQKEEKKETVYTVELQEAETATLRQFVVTTATLRPEKQVDIFSKSAGQILVLNVEEGDQVKAGQVLAQLDGDSATIELEQMRVNLDKAQQEFERFKKSHSNNLVSQEEFETRKFQFEKAQADYRMAEYKQDITQIKAPFSGTILRRSIELGQTIQTSQACFTLANMSPMETDIFVPEREANNIRLGQSAHISSQDNFDKHIAGRVHRISPEVDAKTGTVKVTLAMDEVPFGYRPGAYVHLRIITGEETVSASLPKKALLFDARQKTSVFVASENEDGKLAVTKKEVVCGIEESGVVAINSGLEPGDRVVVTGKDGLKDGSLVQVTEEKES